MCPHSLLTYIISHVPRTFDYLGPFGVLWVHMAWHKNCVKKSSPNSWFCSVLPKSWICTCSKDVHMPSFIWSWSIGSTTARVRTLPTFGNLIWNPPEIVLQYTTTWTLPYFQPWQGPCLDHVRLFYHRWGWWLMSEAVWSCIVGWFIGLWRYFNEMSGTSSAYCVIVCWVYWYTEIIV